MAEKKRNLNGPAKQNTAPKQEGTKTPVLMGEQREKQQYRETKESKMEIKNGLSLSFKSEGTVVRNPTLKGHEARDSLRISKEAPWSLMWTKMEMNIFG